MTINSNNKEHYDKYVVSKSKYSEWGPGRTETPCDYPRSDAERNGNIQAMKMSLSESQKGEGRDSDTLYH